MWMAMMMSLSLTATASGPAPAERSIFLEQCNRLARVLPANPEPHLPEARAVLDRWFRSAPDQASLQLFHRRIQVLFSLRDEVVTQLQAAGQDAVDKLVGDLWENKRSPKAPTASPPSSKPIVPAEQLYRLYLPYFRYAIDTQGLDSTEMAFLRAYYNAEVQAAISRIMRLGRPLAAAAGTRSFELEYYLILLPLLHQTEHFSVESLRELPPWVLASEHLKRLADFCLLRAGRLDAAEAIALKLKDQQPTAESRHTFYLESCDRCLAAHVPAAAVACLKAALGLLQEHDPRAVALRFRICEIWAAARNWALAAGEAGQIAQDFSNTAEGGRALFNRLRYLTSQGDAQTILLEIDDAIQNPHCQDHLSQLYYYKWKALRQAGQGQAASLLLKRFLEQFPEDPNGAEMYFAVARDCLSAQRYEEATSILESLKTRYPKTKFVTEAKQLLERLYQMRGKAETPSPTTKPAAS